MEVMLLKDDVNLGDKGALVDVSSGFARNFLFPNRLAIRADSAFKKHMAAVAKQRQKKLAKEKEAKQAEVKTLESKEYVISAKAGEGNKLYGAVTHAQIAEAITQQSGISIDKRKVQSEAAIKKTGSHEITIKLHPELEARIKLKVEAEKN